MKTTIFRQKPITTKVKVFFKPGDEECEGVGLVLDKDEGMRSFKEEKGKRRNIGRRIRAMVK